MKYPLYVISKGRADCCLTSRELSRMQVPHRVVIEPTELDAYKRSLNEKFASVLVLPFHDLGQGSIPARNWVWEHSKREQAPSHWILDDNIRRFFRMNNDTRYYVRHGDGCFTAAEDFVDRYENVAIAGFNYSTFAVTGMQAYKPFRVNHRVYSCLLIKNSIPYRWRGKYNEDTDLCLRVLKDGWCTVMFDAFLIGKAASMTMRGGNTDTVYATGDNRLEFARSLQRQHPDVVEVVQRYGRWHHKVNYKPFRGNKLILKQGIVVDPTPNEYGMRLVRCE